MSSSTIRYFGVPENSHSRESASTQTTDADSYATAAIPTRAASAPRASDQPEARPSQPDPADSAQAAAIEHDLTLKWRKRLAETVPGASYPAVPGSGSGPGSGPDADSVPVPLPVVSAGTAGPVSPDPRHNPAYPHPKNPGLFEEPSGFFDWAGRRLFLRDGAPDPMTPGAYRYQTRPDLCLLDAADDDPWSPRYEPDHLRHKPGDDWLIDKHRPYDVLDPGPFGSPGWFPDRRTGRHRRDELPDPIPWWEIEEDPLKAEWAESAEALYDRRTRITREREAREAAQAAARTDTRNGPGGPTGPVSTHGRNRSEESGGFSGPDRIGGADGSGGSDRRSGTPITWSSAAEQPDRAPRERFLAPEAARSEPPHRFTRLQEQAWDQFLIESEGLAMAHTRPIVRPSARSTALERECGPHIAVLYRLFLWLAWLFASLRSKRSSFRNETVAKPGPGPAPGAAARPAPGPIPAPRSTSDTRPGPGVAPPTARTARHTDPTAHAARTAQFARAVRGAQRARAEQPAAQPAAHLAGVPAWA